ncbi:conidiophore development protein hymA [Pyricularia oryzae]|nr:conidiophore development protein hymA [Pyricularia oryzae]KAI7931566.1 conidiophore development protein hymA [Pyricularia oryzae]
MTRIPTSSEIDFTFLSARFRGLAGAYPAVRPPDAKPNLRYDVRQGERREARGRDESLDEHMHLLLSSLDDDNG